MKAILTTVGVIIALTLPGAAQVGAKKEGDARVRKLLDQAKLNW